MKQKYNACIEVLKNLAIKKQTICIQDFLDLLKKDYNIKFSIYGNKNFGIYHLFWDISQDCIDEKIPNITTQFIQKVKYCNYLID